MKKIIFTGFILLISLVLISCVTSVNFNINFDSNGGSAVEPVISDGRSNITMPPNPTKEGYTFEGWFWDNDSFELLFTTNSLLEAPLTESFTVYAKWAIITYTINYVMDGGTNSNSNPIEYTYETSNITLEAPAKMGHTFIGWYDNALFTGDSISIIETSTLSDITIYAKWSINEYTMTFESNGGSTIEPVTQEFGTVVAEPEDPTKVEHNFVGWFTDVELTQAYNFGSELTEDITLYAKWHDPSSYLAYYQGLSGATGTALLLELRTIINQGVTLRTYGEARYILDETDADPNNPGNIILVYLGTSIDGTWDAGATWNREHVWPQSLLGTSSDNSVANVASDLQNLKPANPSTNSSRGNKYYDNTTTTSSYAPRNEVKGDIARILFYMMTMYDYLELINGTPAVYQMAMLDILIQWHEQDPVDDFERNRNEIIYSYQNNRNPFIDHPEFVDQIWGDATETNFEDEFFNISQYTFTSMVVNLEESHYNRKYILV